MKKLILLLLYVPLLSNSQVRDTIPFKKADKLRIENGYSGRQNLFLLESALLNKGYTVITDHKEFTVQTRDSVIENGKASYTLNGIVKANSVELTGYYHVQVVTSPLGESQSVYNYEISNRGLKGSLPQRVFILLEDIAKEIEGTLFYIKEKKKKMKARGSVF